MAYLENLHPGGQPFFRAHKRCSGGFAIACVLDMMKGLQSDVLDGYPKLKGFHAAMLALPAFDGIRDLPMYFNR